MRPVASSISSSYRPLNRFSSTTLEKRPSLAHTSSTRTPLSVSPHKLEPPRNRKSSHSQRSALTSSPESTWVTLSTAHPAKFNSAVELALSADSHPDFNFNRDVLPDELKALDGLEKRIHKVKGEQGVRDLIEKVKGTEHAPGKEGKGSI